MRTKNTKIAPTCDYIHNYKPKRIYWKVIAGSPLSEAQMSDIVFDPIDYKIRGLKWQ